MSQTVIYSSLFFIGVIIGWYFGLKRGRKKGGEVTAMEAQPMIKEALSFIKHYEKRTGKRVL